MLFAAAILSAGIGLALGVLGGGGSILAVPVLVYVARIPVNDAVAMSLVIVGATSLVASVAHHRCGQVDVRVASIFGASGIVGSFFGARLTHLVSPRVLLFLFAVILLAVGTWMAIGRRTPQQPRQRSLLAAIAAGGAVGALTGFIGVGGGFLIVPALVAFTALPIRKAVGTSLVIIALSSAAGFLGHLGRAHPSLGLTALFTAVSVTGALAGKRLVGRVSPEHLRQAFAGFVVLVGLFVAIRSVGGT